MNSLLFNFDDFFCNFERSSKLSRNEFRRPRKYLNHFQLNIIKESNDT